MASPTEWTALQQRLARREHGATETLYAYVRELCATRGLRDGQEDLVHDLMQHAVRQLLDESRSAQLLRIRDLRAFLSTMVANLQRRGFRDRRRDPASLDQVLGPGALVDSTASQPDDRAQRADVAAAMRASIRKLKAADREILHLRWVEGLLPSAIATLLSEQAGHEVPRATVDTRLRRAYQRLRTALGDTGVFPTQD